MPTGRIEVQTTAIPRHLVIARIFWIVMLAVMAFGIAPAGELRRPPHIERPHAPAGEESSAA